MRDSMAAVLQSFYGFAPEDAREILTELRDTRSVARLAGYTGTPEKFLPAEKAAGHCAKDSCGTLELGADAVQPDASELGT